MTDLEMQKLAGELAEAIAIAIEPVVKAAVRIAVEECLPKPNGVPRHTLTVPRRG